MTSAFPRKAAALACVAAALVAWRSPRAEASGPAPAATHDWDGLPVPADPGEGRTWRLQEEVSDDFNEEAPPGGRGRAFSERWTDAYHNAWTGHGRTLWDGDHVSVSVGRLRILASRAPGADRLRMGCVTSRRRVMYPLYIEARAKISDTTLASDVWMLSPDDTQEIDVLEAYGASRSEAAGTDQAHFAERLHLSHHVFTREPFRDYQPTDAGTWHRDGTLWREDFHRVGVHWRDPWHLEYYVDGKLVRTASGPKTIDPEGLTGGTGLAKAMDIIINAEDQSWRAERGLTPTPGELADPGRSTFQVDWIRVYKPEGRP